jgi:hypothetical protein
MSTVRWHPEERANVGDRKGLCYKFGVTGGWKSTREMYELIRWEMIDGRRETRTQCIMLQESEAHRGLQRQGRTTQWRDVYGEMGVESGSIHSPMSTPTNEYSQPI